MADEEDPVLFELVKAAGDGNLENVKQFVSKENVDKSCFDFTALGAACWSGNFEIVKFLLDFGADANVKSNVTTPLQLACDEAHVDVVTTLLDHGANIEGADWYQRTALHRACDADHDEVVCILLDRGADVGAVDEEKWTPLHTSRSGRVAQTLLENGAEVNARDGQGFTPLARMSICDDMDRFATLLDYGAGSGIICGLQHSKFDQSCTKTVLMCCYSSCHEQVFQDWLPCFEKYFIKSEVAGKQNEVEKPVDPPRVGVDWSEYERDAYKEQCLQEQERMKVDYIANTSATYFSLLKRNISDLRGQQILHNIKWDDCQKKYPIYGNMIRCSYQSLRRFFLKDHSLEFFSLTPDCLLPECADMVLDYLPDGDLETIYMIVHPPSVTPR